jgi:hypothetical protein
MVSFYINNFNIIEFTEWCFQNKRVSELFQRFFTSHLLERKHIIQLKPSERLTKDSVWDGYVGLYIHNYPSYHHYRYIMEILASTKILAHNKRGNGFPSHDFTTLLSPAHFSFVYYNVRLFYLNSWFLIIAFIGCFFPIVASANET